MRVDFSPPDIGDEEIEEVIATLRSGWITTGPRTKNFENAIAQFCSVNTAVCLNSATAALELILRVLGIGEGDEVITSAYTYTASASVIKHVGAKIVLVDTAPGSYEMDYEKVEQAVTAKTKAIIGVDIGGIICDYEKLFKIAERKKSMFSAKTDIQKLFGRLIVIADSAHGFGAKKDGKMSGNIADFTSFSFHAVKNLTTAEGGAAVWKPREGIDDAALYHEFQLLSLHGQSKDALAKTKPGSWEYDIVYPAYKCNMTDIMAAIGLRQLDSYQQKLARREAIITYYDGVLKPLGIGVLNHYSDNARSSGHLYLTRTPGINGEQRNGIITEMALAEISCNVHYKPLPMMTAYKNLGFDIADYPNAFAQFENEISLPLHTCLTDAQVEYTAKTFAETVKKYIAGAQKDR